MTDQVAISVTNISKHYRLYDQAKDRLKEALHPFKKKYHHEFHALTDINFTVRKGETVGILGKNGAGKSTLLKIITGVLTPSSGTVVVTGKIASLLELGAGFNIEYTGLENIYFQGSLMGFSREEMTERLNTILEFADIGEFIHQPVKMYSSGMFARLAFSIAINVEPNVLIVDEALSVGDTGFQLKCFLKMQQMKEDGVTILFVSHSTQSVAQLCDSAMILDQGRLLDYSNDVVKIISQYNEVSRNTKKTISRPPDVPANIDNDFEEHTYSKELGDGKEHRFGNQEAKILSVNLFNQKGMQTNIFEPLERISLSILVKSFVVCENSVLGFSLKNVQGVDMCGDNSMLIDKLITLEVGVHKFTFTFDVRLARGDYFLGLGLASLGECRVELDQRTPIRKIIIESNREVIGSTFSPAQLVYERIGETGYIEKFV